MSEAISVRHAAASDLRAVVEMLANEPLGQGREVFVDPLPDQYVRAFEMIEQDPNNHVLVAVSGEQLVGCLQVTIIPNLSHGGMTRAQIEGVRVHQDWRGRQLGNLLVNQAISEARDRGCGMVQLTTDKMRPDALRFYQSLGFVASHEGMKLKLYVATES